MIRAARERGCRVVGERLGRDATTRRCYLDAGADAVLARRGRGHALPSWSTRGAPTSDRARWTRSRGLALREREGMARDVTPPRPRVRATSTRCRCRRGISWTSTRYRRRVARRARPALVEHGDVARLPVRLQLVREADVRPALHAARRRARWPRRCVGSSARCAPDHVWFADDIFGLTPGWIERVRRRRSSARRAHAVHDPVPRRPDDARRRRARCAAPAARRCGSASSRARSGSSTRWKRARTVEQIRAATRHAAARAASARAGSCSSAIPARRGTTSLRTRDLVRDCAARRHRRLRVAIRCRARSSTQPVQAQLGAQRNWEDTDELAMLFQGTYMTEFYRAFGSCCMRRCVGARERPRRVSRSTRAQRAGSDRGQLPLGRGSGQRVRALAPRQARTAPRRSAGSRSTTRPRSPATPCRRGGGVDSPGVLAHMSGLPRAKARPSAGSSRG